MQNRRTTLGLILLFFFCNMLMAQSVTGRASYYSDKLHGNYMSNGEKYNKNEFTCAHMKYPFGTLLKVKNLTNGKSVIVKVTDRGPFGKRFVIDLSKAAARELDMIRAGHCLVEITPYYGLKVPYRANDQSFESEVDASFLPASKFGDFAWQQTDSLLHKKKEEPHVIKHLNKKVKKILKEKINNPKK